MRSLDDRVTSAVAIIGEAVLEEKATYTVNSV
jgi:hypothetical protein